MAVRLVVGLLLTALALAMAGRRVWWLYRLIRTGQPAPGRTDQVAGAAAGRGGRGLRSAQAAEVVGARASRTSSRSGVSSSWALTIVEAFGALFDRDFHIPLIGQLARCVGFLEDFFAVAVLVGLATSRSSGGAQRAGPPASGPRASTARTPGPPG